MGIYFCFIIPTYKNSRFIGLTHYNLLNSLHKKINGENL